MKIAPSAFGVIANLEAYSDNIQELAGRDHGRNKLAKAISIDEAAGMIRRRTTLAGIARNAAVSLVGLCVLLAVFGARLLAQQYCVSGAITSVLNCNSCNFNIGDPVAITFTVTSGSVTCTGTINCLANDTLSANIGARSWTEQSVAYGDQISVNSGSALLTGTAFLSPPDPAAMDNDLDVTFEISGSNLLASGTLPASLPSPSALAASHGFVSFSATTEGGGSPQFSYTGQTCAAATTAKPAINTSGVVPLFSTATTIQPGSFISIYGTNLAAAFTQWNGNFPTILGNTSVTIDGKLGYLVLVSPTQINLQAPDDTATGSVAVVVTTPSGSATSTVTLGTFGPSFSLLGDAKNHVAGIILHGDGSYDVIGPTGNSLGYATVAATAGDTIELFGVGFGPTTPAFPAGQPLPTGAYGTATNPIRLVINGTTLTPSFAGVTEAGLFQFNLTLPAGLGTGDVPLVATVGGVQTPANVVIALE